MHWPHLFITFIAEIEFAPIDHLCRWFESVYIMAHLVHPKCLFHIRTCTMMLTLSISYFKKAPSILNFCLLVKPTQPIKITCWLELPCTPIWPNPMLCEWYVVFSEWFINQAKEMLNEQCVMITIITNVEMLILNHIAWLGNVIHTINIHLCMFVQDMYEYRHLMRMIALTQYLLLGRECVILIEV